MLCLLLSPSFTSLPLSGPQDPHDLQSDRCPPHWPPASLQTSPSGEGHDKVGLRSPRANTPSEIGFPFSMQCLETTSAFGRALLYLFAVPIQTEPPAGGGKLWKGNFSSYSSASCIAHVSECSDVIKLYKP